MRTWRKLIDFEKASERLLADGLDAGNTSTAPRGIRGRPVPLVWTPGEVADYADSINRRRKNK